MPEVFPALLGFLGRGPTVAAVEDLHWADDATLDAMRYLARRVPTSPIVLVATFRESGVDGGHPLHSSSADWSAPSVDAVALSNRCRVAAVAARGVGHAEAAEVHRVTGGNPFFVTEVIAAGGTRCPPRCGTQSWADRGLGAGFRERCCGCSWSRGAQNGGLPRPLATDQELGGGGGVRRARRRPDGVAFRHELARRAMESSLTAGTAGPRRWSTHFLAARSVPSRLVHHARSGQNEELVALGPEAAAEAARQGAHRQAVECSGSYWTAALAACQVAGAVDEARLLGVRGEPVRSRSRGGARHCSGRQGRGPGSTSGRPRGARAGRHFRARPEARSRRPSARSKPRAGEGLPRLAAALTELARAHSNLPSVSVVAQPRPRPKTLPRRH